MLPQRLGVHGCGSSHAPPPCNEPLESEPAFTLLTHVYDAGMEYEAVRPESDLCWLGLLMCVMSARTTVAAIAWVVGW